MTRGSVDAAMAQTLGRHAVPQRRRTFHRYFAGVRSALPALSIAVTLSRCRPGSSFLRRYGDLQALAFFASSLQTNLDPASDDLNLNFARVALVVFGGVFVILVLGGVRSGMDQESTTDGSPVVSVDAEPPAGTRLVPPPPPPPAPA